jgi:hypothetical protein
MIGEKAQIKNVFVDRGYRGHKNQGPESVSVDQLRRGAIPKWMWRLMKRRAAIAPTIGHMKTEHRLEGNRLKGTCGDAINALLSGVAMNFGKLLAWVWRFWLFLRAVIGGIFSHRYPLPAFLGPAFSEPTISRCCHEAANHQHSSVSALASSRPCGGTQRGLHSNPFFFTEFLLLVPVKIKPLHLLRLLDYGQQVLFNKYAVCTTNSRDN